MNMLKTNGLLALVMTGWCVSAQALPYLQLDISSGIYDTVSEDTVATSNSFTLYGLINTLGGANGGGGNVTFDQGDDFTISVAIVGLAQDATSFGSFSFNGTTYNNLNQLFWGTPPEILGVDLNGNEPLPPHEIFPAWFAEVLFPLTNPLTLVNAYNVQTQPGPVTNSTGTLALISALVDTSGLNAGLSLHFDFYTTRLEDADGDGDPDRVRDKFAPFSHDATSCIAGDTNCGGDDLPPERIPEPSAVALLGIGLLGMGLARKGRRQVA